MKKKLIISLICSIVLILLIIFLCKLIFHKKENNTDVKDYGTLIEIAYSCSGDMSGNVYKIEVSIPYKEIIVQESDAYNEPIVESRYRLVDTKTVNKIENIINKYDLPSLDGADIDDNYFVYDACSPNIKLKYRVGKRSTNNEYYNISFYAKMSNSQRKELSIIENYLYKLVSEDNFLSTKTIERD